MKTYSRIIPFLAVVLGLVSCNKEDLNPLASEVAGMWWKLIEQKGTRPENFGGADYTRIGNAVFLGETGSGYGVTFFFNDDEGDPIYVIGGESVAGLTRSFHLPSSGAKTTCLASLFWYDSSIGRLMS